MYYYAVFLLLLTLALEFWTLIDITKSRFKAPVMRTVWLLIVLFFPVLGSILYFQFKRRLTTKESRKFQPEFRTN